jgi:hypothetical protein
MSHLRRRLCLFLTVSLLVCCLGGCIPTFFPAQVVSPASETAQDTVPSTDYPVVTTTEVPAEGVRGPMPQNGVRWQEVFHDKQLPEDGYIGPDEVGFYLTEADGSHSVLIMTCAELLERVAALGKLPRTRYFQNILGDRFSILFACYDLAIEIGCGMFCFPTTDLRGKDISEARLHISFTFSVINGYPLYYTTKDYVDDEGNALRYITIEQNLFKIEDHQKHETAMEEARKILKAVPEGLNERETAEYLYRYVASTVNYNHDNYYETDWNTLYDALILHSTVCSGFSEAIYCLFNMAGIDCLYVNGTVYNKGETGPHAWNLAKIDGNWYVFDATWDSTLIHEGGFDDILLFFGISDSVVNLYGERFIHRFVADVAPTCNHLLDLNTPILTNP